MCTDCCASYLCWFGAPWCYAMNELGRKYISISISISISIPPTYLSTLISFFSLSFWRSQSSTQQQNKLLPFHHPRRSIDCTSPSSVQFAAELSYIHTPPSPPSLPLIPTHLHPKTTCRKIPSMHLLPSTTMLLLLSSLLLVSADPIPYTCPGAPNYCAFLLSIHLCLSKPFPTQTPHATYLPHTHTHTHFLPHTHTHLLPRSLSLSLSPIL